MGEEVREVSLCRFFVFYVLCKIRMYILNYIVLEVFCICCYD
jgi:hypothetical protein